MAITPALFLPVLTGRSRAEVDDALESETIMAGGLIASDEVFARHGAQHPLGAGFSGGQDLLPQLMDEQTALSHVKAIPRSLLRETCLNGTPDEVVDQAAQWRDHGVRYLVVVNLGPLQRSMRKGLASALPFSTVVGRLKKL